jgi:tetratricopeptide (TPR) repeat protein
MTTKSHHEHHLHVDKTVFNEHISRLCKAATQTFDTIVTFYVYFTTAFAILAFIEFLFIVIFFSFFTHSSILAIALAVTFLTAFSYLVLRLYFQAKRPEQFLELRSDFVLACKEIINYQEGIPEHHMALATASYRLAAKLQGKEYSYYLPPAWLDTFTPTLEKFSCWWHWYDVHKMREHLLLYSIEEHLKLVKCEPTDLEVHATLANAYVILSSLYSSPKKIEQYEEDRWVPIERFSEEMKEKFRITAEHAIEEFKILNDYAPNDPWVHAQLAYSYHDLQMPEEEIKQYEVILSLRPDDKDTLFKLGVLYFQQGFNAKGLQVYEDLKKTHYKKAEDLIKFYGALPLIE